LALAKTPVDLVPGSGGEEKVLKNAKDSCAAEAQEIVTYTALARLARVAGDVKPACRRVSCSRVLRARLRHPREAQAIARAAPDRVRMEG
jgi:hypothetical protein